MPPRDPEHRLCIYCRKLEPLDIICEVIKNASLAPNLATTVIPLSQGSGLSSEDDRLVRSLQSQPSTLCERCASYNIIDMFTKSRPLDQVQRTQPDTPELYREGAQRYIDDMVSYRPSLGRASSLTLNPSCQFCRLLYCILPKNLDDIERELHIEPYRSHIRQEGWEMFPGDLKERSAIFLGLATLWDPFSPASDPFKAGGDTIRYPMMTGPAISMDTRSTTSDRRVNNARMLESKLDLSLLLKPLEYCEKYHGEECGAAKPAELLTTRMIDVDERKVVPCPLDCDYIALSYVWGGVQPSINALENRCLPQTIEDAITVTKALGRRYLWVDALCIDQSPNPSPQVLQKKMQQLGLMATIYGCATVTIVALTGKNANAGLSGISVPRPRQVKETIDGHTLFTVPQYVSVDREASNWSTRAWTLQEELLSLRLMQFTETQVDFSCLGGSFWEGLDISTAYEGHVPTHLTQSLVQMMARAPKPSPQNVLLSSSDKVTEGRTRLFDGVLQTYTARHMTHASDSLNAFLGMLTSFTRILFPAGFTHGLPLTTHPVTLTWFHDRNVVPVRRPQFPSWSWAGWEGKALFPAAVLSMCEAAAASDDEADLTIRVLSVNGNEVFVEGWVVDLDIRTQPFSEVYIPDREDSVAAVMERNFLHNNTLATGRYSCLVTTRLCDKSSGRTPPRQKTYAVVLEWGVDGRARRRTVVTVMSFKGCDFIEMGAERRFVRLV